MIRFSGAHLALAPVVRQLVGAIIPLVLAVPFHVLQPQISFERRVRRDEVRGLAILEAVHVRPALVAGVGGLEALQPPVVSRATR